MKVYLVGGAVRDQLLGLPVKERDWVVIGGTPDELLKQGYQQVGRDFPGFSASEKPAKNMHWQELNVNAQLVIMDLLVILIPK